MNMENFNPSVVITTQQSNHNEWMAFASWRSVNKLMPGSKIASVFPRSHKANHFLWMNRVSLPYLTYGWEMTQARAIENLISAHIITPNVLVIKDTMMVVKPLKLQPWEGVKTAEELDLIGEDKPVADYTECGKFKLNEWVEKEKRHPFHRTASLVSKNRTVNEQRVFQIWRRLGNSFDFINRQSVTS